MALILTFLGKGGVGCTTVAIAAAKQLANQGSRVLLIAGDPSPGFGVLLGISPSPVPQEIGANLQVVQLQSTVLLEQGWEEVKKLEEEYLRSPTLKNVYGQELGLIAGMDSALALKAIREYRDSNDYDVIVYDGAGDLTTIRMFGIPEVTSWYVRRFREVLADSDIGRAISPFIQPVTSAILNVSWSADNFASEPTNTVTGMIEEGIAAVSDPSQMLAYLVTNDDPAAIATAQYLWGSAQQIGLTVAGVLFNQASDNEVARVRDHEEIIDRFAPLNISPLPKINPGDWQGLIDTLPNLKQKPSVPKAITIDSAAKQVRLFLPGFDKKQVKLTQYGPEITIEAGDQRRNILLPSPLSGKPVTGAKFQDGYLIISF